MDTRNILKLVRFVLAGLSIGFIMGLIIVNLGSRPQSPQPGCRGFTEVAISNQSTSYSDNMLYLTIKNWAKTEFNISANGITSSIYKVPCNAAPPTGIYPLRPGQTVKINISCPNLSSKYDVGDRYNADINITYINTKSLITHTSGGNCWGVVE